MKNMDPKIHVNKAARIEKTVKKLDPEGDCESIIEMLGMAGTHLVNGALHKSGVLERDIIHSNFMAGSLGAYEFIEKQAKWEAAKPPTAKSLKEALAQLHEIETRRMQVVRGKTVSGPIAKESLTAYEKLKENFLKIIG